jgi:hypothetical protein
MDDITLMQALWRNAARLRLVMVGMLTSFQASAGQRVFGHHPILR